MTVDVDVLAGLAEEYSAAVRAAGYSNPDLIPHTFTAAELDEFEAASLGLRFQPEHRLLLTSFGATPFPCGDEITTPTRAAIFHGPFWWAVDEGLYEGLPISWMPDRADLPVACRGGTIGWFRDGEYRALPLDGTALSYGAGDRMAAPSIEAWIRFNICLLYTSDAADD